MADRTGQHLGNYRLVRLLGQGGFAEVYLGEHLHLGTQAAIKLLHTQLAGEDTDAFRKEARTIARLVHPHIVRVFDFGIEGETPFLVMDYAPNGTVRKRHPKGVALPIPTILNYIKQAASALQYAHDEHFVHRDVKPENLLLGRQEEILLGDFGIALLAQTSRSQSMQDVAGTAIYMAPEQFQGKPRPASDQYALAVMVYEWLTGACPFHGSFTEIASQHLFVPPPPLQGRTPAISLEVEQVVMTALAKDPKQRFGNVLAFATALEQASQIELAETIPAGRSSQLTELATAPDESLIPTELVTPPSQSALPTEAVRQPSQLGQLSEIPPAPVLTPTPQEVASSLHSPAQLEQPKEKSPSQKSEPSTEQATSVQSRAQQEGAALYRPPLEQVPRSPSPSWSRRIFALLSAVLLSLLAFGLAELVGIATLTTNSGFTWLVLVFFLGFPFIAGIMTAAISRGAEGQSEVILGFIGGIIFGLVLAGAVWIFSPSSTLGSGGPPTAKYALLLCFLTGTASFVGAAIYSSIRNERKKKTL